MPHSKNMVMVQLWLRLNNLPITKNMTEQKGESKLILSPFVIFRKRSLNAKMILLAQNRKGIARNPKQQ